MGRCSRCAAADLLHSPQIGGRRCAVIAAGTSRCGPRPRAIPEGDLAPLVKVKLMDIAEPPAAASVGVGDQVGELGASCVDVEDAGPASGPNPELLMARWAACHPKRVSAAS